MFVQLLDEEAKKRLQWSGVGPLDCDAPLPNTAHWQVRKQISPDLSVSLELLGRWPSSRDRLTHFRP